MASASHTVSVAISLQSRNHVDLTAAAKPPAQDPRPAPLVIIREPDALIPVLQRLKATSAAICMFNADRTFQIMLRSIDIEMGDDDENRENRNDDDELNFDVCLVKPDEDSVVDDAQWETILQLEYDGYLDGDDMVFVMDEWTLSARGSDRKTLLDAVQRINSVYAMSICPCKQYFIKDGGDMCPFCQLTSTAADLKPAYCCVCASTMPRKHMVCQPCCAQPIHAHCLQTWQVRSGDLRCPMCQV